MKKELSIIVGLALTASLSLQAQRTNRTSQIVERGPHHQTVEYVESHTNRTAGLVTKTNRVTTLKTGMNRQVNGEWIESIPELKAVAGGARASGGAHEVFFKSDAAAAAVVQITLPGGARLSGHVLGLYYYDAASGQSVRLATIKSSSGEILPDNEVVYRDCFDGLTADLKYRYEAGRLEQDVVIRENPAPPSAFGLNDQTTRMEVITEFLEGQPSGRRERVMKRLAEGAARQTLVEPDWTDEWLDFGAMQMVNGRAFRAGQQPGREPQLKSHPVGKRWEQVGGRKLLIESVEYEVVEKELSAMNLAPTMPTDRRLQASRGRVLANPLLESALGGEMLVSAQPYAGDGLVIDYDLTASFTNLYLGDLVTYLVEGWVTVSQSLTIYDGAIVKYAPGAKIQVSGYLTTPSSGLAIFTARDDDSVGAILPTSTGQISGMYGYPALELYNVYGTTIRNLQFRHCQIALSDYSGYDNTHYVQYCQFLNCYRGINSNYTPVNCSYLTMCSVYEPFFDHTDPTPLLQQSYTTTLSGCSGGVGAPACNPPGNVYNGAQLVTVTCPTPNVTMRYRLVPAFDTLYTEVTENDPVLPASGQVQVDGAKALMVRAWKNGIPRFSSTSQLHSYLTRIEFSGSVVNSTLAGITFLPINLGDYVLDYDSLNLLIDGQQFKPYLVPNPLTIRYLQAGPQVDFERLENGSHTIQAKIAFLRNDVLGKNSDIVELATPVIPFQANNSIRYPAWNDQIGSGSYAIKAKTTKPNTAFTISVKDSSGNNIKTLTGQTDAQGGLNATWNLTDNQGNPRGNLPTDPFVTFDITVHSTPVALLGFGKAAVDEYPEKGAWIVAAMDGFLGYDSAYLDQQFALQALTTFISGAAAYSGTGVEKFNLYFSDGNAFYGDPDPYGPFISLQDIQNKRNARWKAFKLLLANHNNRNLYYNGHGSGISIGGDVPDTLVINGVVREIGSKIKKGSKAFLTQVEMLEIRKKHFGLNSGYRFVFLDGCQTGNVDWPEAFGLLTSEATDLSPYQSEPAGQRPRPGAFVGWKETIAVGLDGFGNWDSYKYFRSEFFNEWSRTASGTNPVGDITMHDSLLHAQQLSNWISLAKFNQIVFVSGYSPLKFNEYNQKADWVP